MTTRVLYIERIKSHFVSLENVFRQIASKLPDEFETDFQQVTYGNDLLSMIRNLLFFRKHNSDIYHITGHIHYMAMVLPKERTLLTIHDLGFLHTRKGIRRYALKKLLLDWPLERLKLITVISEFTEREILKHTKVDPRKLRVIENPLGPHLVSAQKPPFNADCPTILQIGTMKNKNIYNLAAAIEGLNCKLRIVGPLTAEISVHLTNLKIDHETVSGLDDAAMAKEYQKADIVAFCSTYEGFGLPIIEAQAMGTPVVTSDLSPMKEVAGDAAVLTDPFDPQSIRLGIVSLIKDSMLRRSLVSKGTVNVRRFDAVEISRRYADVYRELKNIGLNA